MPMPLPGPTNPSGTPPRPTHVPSPGRPASRPNLGWAARAPLNQVVIVSRGRPDPIWVTRPTLSVGYGMPVPRRRAASPWGYTLPCEVRGAFIRVLGGILLKRGASRACLTTLHQFCATPTPPPLCARGAQPRNGSTAVVRPRRGPLAGGSPQRPRRPSALLALRPGAGYVGPRPFTSQGCRRSLVRRGCPWAPLAPRPPRPTHIDTWALLQAQPHMAYGLKYCRLSRRVRKILRNRYRYSKYFFMVPPAKRLAATLHL